MTLYIVFLILMPAIWIIVEGGLVIRDGSRGKGTTTRDKSTRLFNSLSIVVGISAAAILNGFSQFFFPGGRTVTCFYVGLAITLVGMALRYWAVWTLGASFRTTIETEKGQKVVSRGPYKLIRHPSYAGWLLMCFGYGLALQNWLSLLVAVLLPLAALLYRIHVEEGSLASSLGPDYVEYQKRTKRLVPWVW